MPSGVSRHPSPFTSFIPSSSSSFLAASRLNGYFFSLGGRFGLAHGFRVGGSLPRLPGRA